MSSFWEENECLKSSSSLEKGMFKINYILSVMQIINILCGIIKWYIGNSFYDQIWPLHRNYPTRNWIKVQAAFISLLQMKGCRYIWSIWESFMSEINNLLWNREWMSNMLYCKYVNVTTSEIHGQYHHDSVLRLLAMSLC